MPTIKKGSKGKAVQIWQIIVGVEPDGDFGSNTLKATKAFQKANGLEVDGVVGPKSWKAGLEAV
jgi:peptidoglycan hydrolase-like protein with peptidoglycan-binding domain